MSHYEEQDNEIIDSSISAWSDEEAHENLDAHAENALEGISSEDFHKGRMRRYGSGNPERMQVAFLDAMIRLGEWAYAARKKFQHTEFDEPIWCASRFGQTETQVDPEASGGDRLVVKIAGEHEDWYDPDFMIYNDVIVFYPGQDNRFEVYGYPEEAFPQTDFHSATPVGRDWIYIIGNLGYTSDRKAGVTPVYRLSVKDWSIEKVDTSGQCPGWISRHVAELKGGEIWITGGSVWSKNEEDELALVDNHDTWVLDLETKSWRKQSQLVFHP
jgi:hypothetical protein